MAVKHRLWLTGARVLAVVAASTAAVTHNRRPEINSQSSSSSSSTGSKDLILSEKWRETTEYAFVAPPPQLARKHSFATSTRSTCSVITYMRSRGILSFLDGSAGISIPRVEVTVVATEGEEAEEEERRENGEIDLSDATINRTYDVSAGHSRPSLSETSRDNIDSKTFHWEIAVVDASEQGEGAANGDFGKERNVSLLHHQNNLPSTLYHQSVTLFTTLAPLMTSCPELENSSHLLLEDLGRLYLWSHDFKDGQLDALLETSNELKSTILELTATISRILTTVIYPLLLDPSADSSLVEQVELVTELLRHTQNYSSESNVQDEAYASESEDSEDGFDIDDAALVIRSSVDCLMGLLPSMERSLLSVRTKGKT